MEEMYEALRLFGELAHSNEFMYKTRLKPGEMIAFSNRRILHGRSEIVSSKNSSRWLQGAYVDLDEVYSKQRCLVGINNDGEELFHWFMSQSNCISGYTKAFWSGVTTLELAKAVSWSIDSNITGLYHVTNNHKISKYELLKLFQKFTNKNIEIKPIEGIDIDRSFVDTRRLLNYKIPSYEKMISDMVNIIINNRSLYSQYKVESIDKK